jgi:anti-sigma factor RsiW
MANLLARPEVEMDTMRRLLSKVMRPNPRKCEEARALMSDYVDEALDPDARKRVERHVRFCDRCHTVLGNLRQTLGRLRRLQEAAPAGGADPDAVAGRVARGWREQV